MQFYRWLTHEIVTRPTHENLVCSRKRPLIDRDPAAYLLICFINACISMSMREYRWKHSTDGNTDGISFFFCQHQSPHDPRVLIDLSAWSRYVNTKSLAIPEFWQIAPSPPLLPQYWRKVMAFCDMDIQEQYMWKMFQPISIDICNDLPTYLCIQQPQPPIPV